MKELAANVFLDRQALEADPAVGVVVAEHGRAPSRASFTQRAVGWREAQDLQRVAGVFVRA